MNDYNKNVIEYLSQHKNILWTGIIVLTGGLVGLILTYNPILSPGNFINIVRISLILIGGPLLIAMIIGLLNTDCDIKEFLKKRCNNE